MKGQEDGKCHQRQVSTGAVRIGAHQEPYVQRCSQRHGTKAGGKQGRNTVFSHLTWTLQEPLVECILLTSDHKRTCIQFCIHDKSVSHKRKENRSRKQKVSEHHGYSASILGFCSDKENCLPSISETTVYHDLNFNRVSAIHSNSQLKPKF